jgi:hypothetical protein
MPGSRVRVPPLLLVEDGVSHEVMRARWEVASVTGVGDATHDDVILWPIQRVRTHVSSTLGRAGRRTADCRNTVIADRLLSARHDD